MNSKKLFFLFLVFGRSPPTDRPALIGNRGLVSSGSLVDIGESLPENLSHLPSKYQSREVESVIYEEVDNNYFLRFGMPLGLTIPNGNN